MWEFWAETWSESAHCRNSSRTAAGVTASPLHWTSSRLEGCRRPISHSHASVSRFFLTLIRRPDQCIYLYAVPTSLWWLQSVLTASRAPTTLLLINGFYWSLLFYIVARIKPLLFTTISLNFLFKKVAFSYCGLQLWPIRPWPMNLTEMWSNMSKVSWYCLESSRHRYPKMKMTLFCSKLSKHTFITGYSCTTSQPLNCNMISKNSGSKMYEGNITSIAKYFYYSKIITTPTPNPT